MSAPASDGFVFKSCRRVAAPGTMPAPLQAEAGGVAVGRPETAATPFRPFKAYALAYAAKRTGAPALLLASTLSIQRSSVRDKFVTFYKDAATGQRQWAQAVASGARILRVIVTADPEFVLPVAVRS